MKITVATWVQNRTEQTAQPGASPNRLIQLQSVSPKDSVDNAVLFDAGAPGNVSVNLNGLTKDMHAAILAGASVTVIIDTGS